eukprot:gene22850-22221_t
MSIVKPRDGFSTNYKLTPVRMDRVNGQRQLKWNTMRCDFNTGQSALMTRAQLPPKGRMLPLNVEEEDEHIQYKRNTLAPENLHPTYAFPAAAGSAGNYAPGKLVWSSKDKHTVPVDAALTGHTTVVDHHPEANHPQRHEVFVEPSRVAFTTEGTRTLPDIRGAIKARAQAGHAPSWFGGRIHKGYVSSAKSAYASPFYVTHMAAV